MSLPRRHFRCAGFFTPKSEWPGIADTTRVLISNPGALNGFVIGNSQKPHNLNQFQEFSLLTNFRRSV
jgi:hypothetical protein